MLERMGARSTPMSRSGGSNLAMRHSTQRYSAKE
jgi:hypothetical protein